jgi:hypothetical protein
MEQSAESRKGVTAILFYNLSHLLKSVVKIIIAVSTAWIIESELLLAQQTHMLDDFESYSIGQVPNRWYDRDGTQPLDKYDQEERERRFKYYVTEEPGNQFLRFEGTKASHLNYPLIDKDYIDIYQTPILSWKWRVFDIPTGGNEKKNKLNDVAASIYVVYHVSKLFKMPTVIRYTWSSSLNVGTELNKNLGYQKIIVVASGKSRMGEWQTFERNIVDDYRKLFNEDPPHKPVAILILSDADDTKDPIKADYDDILLKSDQ